MSSFIRYSGPIYITGLMWATACGADAAGVDPCSADDILCSRQSLSSAYDEVAVEELPTLQPTWSKALPVAEEAADASGYFSAAQLSSDREGRLWLFARDPEGVRVSRLDDEGTAVESTLLRPPPGAKTPAAVGVNANWESNKDPSSKLVWTPGDGCNLQSPGALSSCQGYEKVIFDRGLGEEPLRVPLAESLMSDAVVNDRGELFYIATATLDDPPSITKLVRDSRNVVWKKADYSTPLGNDFDLSAAALDDGRLVVMRHGAAAYINSVVLYWLEADGRGSEELFGASVDKSFYRLFGSGPAPVLIFTDEIGDLHVRRHDPRDPSNPDGVSFLRQHYAMHDLHASAISPSGDVYVATQSGGRDAGQTTLCRAPVQGASGCVTVPAIVNLPADQDKPSNVQALVAKDGGVVFVQSGVSLLRLDFPN